MDRFCNVLRHELASTKRLLIGGIRFRTDAVAMTITKQYCSLTSISPEDSGGMGMNNPNKHCLPRDLYFRFFSECRPHLGEYAANRGFSRISQISRIRFLLLFVRLMWILAICVGNALIKRVSYNPRYLRNPPNQRFRQTRYFRISILRVAVKSPAVSV